MATNTGNVGMRFDITNTTDPTDTGSATIQHEIEDAVGDLTITDTDVPVSFAGNVGTTAAVIDLSALDNFTGGTDTLKIQNATAPIALTTIKAIYVHNKSVNTVTVKANASESFLPASDQMTIPTLSAKVVYNGADKTVASDTNDKFTIESDVDASEVEIYIIGN